MSIITEDDLAYNNARRVPTVLCIDTSSSMGYNDKQELLNKALKEFYAELRNDPLTKYAIDISIIEFNDELTVREPLFQSIRQGSVPQISKVEGMTHLAEAVDKGIDLLEEIKELYTSRGIGYYQPWLVILSDGRSEGEDNTYIKRVAARSSGLEAKQKLTVIPAFIGNPPQSVLDDFSAFSAVSEAQSFDPETLSLFFKWFSDSLSTVAHSSASNEARITASDFARYRQSMDSIG